MNRAILTIETNTPLTATTWRMTLLGDTSAITAPGQFVNLALEGRFLPFLLLHLMVEVIYLLLPYKKYFLAL